MTRTLAILCLLSIAGLSTAQEDAGLERLKAARVAAEAKLKLGDLLRQKGDLAGAEREYRAANRIMQEALGQPPAKKVTPKVVAPKPAVGVQKGPQRRALRATGGAARTETAVDMGLKWLAENQHGDKSGRWDADGIDTPGGALYDVGVTGLSLLAFLGAGHTDKGAEKQNPYAGAVRDGLRYLLTVQDEEGCIGPRASQHYIYNHAIACAAICEAYGLTNNPRYKAPAQGAVDFLLRARNPYMGWRYGIRPGENDTSVTAWCVVALHAGKTAGLQVDPNAFEGARAWFDKMTDPEFGRVGYNMPGGMAARPEGMIDRFPAERTQSLTAAAMFARILMGEDPKKSAIIQKGASLCAAQPPVWDPKAGTIDMYYWYYGTLAMFQVGGSAWKKWNNHMKSAIADNQHREGARAGSWDPIGVWGADGGRIYSTALMTMCLEVYYRYARVAKEG
ncbi:MAG: prenyltransferase/squalene oxidase repeat-containing protein [Planctomycetota bacterium]